MQILNSLNYYTHPESVNLLHQFLTGQEQFDLAWTTEGVESDDIILDPLLTRSSTVLVRGTDINRTHLERQKWTSNELINDRLRTRADDSVTNIKKSLSFFPKYTEDNGNYKTGMNKKKMASGRWKFVSLLLVLTSILTKCIPGLLDDMWKVLHTKKEKPEAGEVNSSEGTEEVELDVPSKEASLVLSDDEDDDVVLVPSKRTEGWFFRGYMSLMIFGPFPENKAMSKQVLDFTKINVDSDPVKAEKKSYGRSACREADSKADAFERGHDAKRGNNKVEQALIDTCKMQSSMLQGNKQADVLFSLNQRADRTVRLMDMASKRAVSNGDWSAYDSHESELKVIHQQIVALEDALKGDGQGDS